jgi:TM2 domain-containing membrane protein YozV
MKCAYHPVNAASARCSACERPLCPVCDHRIKGYPYCQDCIVAGIETLRRKAASGQRIHHSEEKSPLLALLLGLIPGLGATYNGQNIKALMHFVAVLGLWTLADIFAMPLELTFGLGAVAFHLYSIYDAFRSAKLGRRGEDLVEEDDRLKLFLQQRMNLFGGLLIGVGALAILNVAFPALIGRFWPLLLILAGVYFIWSYQRGKSGPQVKTVYRTPPPSVIPSGFDRTTSDFARNQYREQ